MHLRLRREQLGQDASEPQRLLAQLGPHPVVAGGRRVALVEDQVDDLEHRRRGARRARSRAGTSNGTRASASVRLARTMRCAMVASGTRKARAISLVVRPPSRRSVSATRASVESTGWQARRSGAGDRRRTDRRSRPRDRGSRPRRWISIRPAPRLSLRTRPPQAVERAVLGRGHEPRARIVRDARLRPLLERGNKRLLREVLGQADVAQDAGQSGDEPRRTRSARRPRSCG